MSPFGWEADEIERRGGQWTAREIVQQPQVWEKVAALARNADAPAARLLAPLLQRPDLRIVLTGAGSSAFVGECLAPALQRRTQRWVAAVPTTDLVAAPRDWLPAQVPTLLVSFARSGNSPESVAALELAQQCVRDCHHLVVTCNAQGALALQAQRMPNAAVLCLPEEVNDRSFAMTSSFTSMLLAAAQLLGARDDIAGAALAAGGWARHVLGPGMTTLQEIVRQGFERVVYLGAGEHKGLAREAALKLLELTDGAIVAASDTPLGFRHGPKTIVNGRTLVVVLLSNDRYTRRYDLDLLAELRRDALAGRVLALGGEGGQGGHAGASPADRDDLIVPGTAGARDLELCLPYAVFAQSLALLQSLALGRSPDNPNAAGAVHRVVRGVTIHRLEDAS
jgi:tagatose-6-phosphate ketose/aldose isomerase